MYVKSLIASLLVMHANASVDTVIFLAGESTRFKGETSKILTPIGNMLIMEGPLQAAHDLNMHIIPVIGHKKEEVQRAITDLFPNANITFAVQDKQLGTGHALQCTRAYWQADNIMVLNGDHPLTSAYTLSKLMLSHELNGADITMLIAPAPSAACNWGRIVTQNGKIKIVEAADFNKDLAAEFPMVNASYFIFKRSFLEEHIDELWLHENKKEYYVTDLIEIANRYDLKINCIEVPFDDVFGINTQEEFHYAQQLLKKKMACLPQTIFKEHDIHGIVDKELNLDQIYTFGRSCAYFLKRKQLGLKTVVIGMDDRTHSPIIAQALIAALRDSGLDVISIGLCPTPCLYFAIHRLHVDAGIMITASDNPKEYNGFKIMLGSEPVWGAQLQDLYDDYQAKRTIPTDTRGTYQQQDIMCDYMLAKHT